MLYSIDLKPFYETTDIKPLINGHIVKHGKTTYRVARHFSSVGGQLVIGPPRKRYYTRADYITLPTEVHCYVFIDITMDVPVNKLPFAKKPSEIKGMIKSNKMIITHIPGWN